MLNVQGDQLVPGKTKVVTVQDALEFGEPEDVNKMIKELEKN